MKDSLTNVTAAHQLERLAQEQIAQKQANLAQQSQNGRLLLLQELAKRQEAYLQEMQDILASLDVQAS